MEFEKKRRTWINLLLLSYKNELQKSFPKKKLLSLFGLFQFDGLFTSTAE